MKPLSEAKRRILQECVQNNNKPIPRCIQNILQLAGKERYSIEQKLKNLQDPLSYIHSQKIQNLIGQAQQFSKNLHKQMDTISQFSKTTYKQVVSRQKNQFDFEIIEANFFRNDSMGNNSDIDLIKQKSKTFQKEKNKTYKQKKQSSGDMHQILKHSHIQNFRKQLKAFQLKQYKHNMTIKQQQSKEEAQKIDLNYSHIKIIDTPAFDNVCKNVELYDMLKSERPQKYRIYNQQFDIDNNADVQKAISKLSSFDLIQDSIQYGNISKQLFFDFHQNIKFWRQKNTGLKGIEQLALAQQRLEERIISVFSQYDKKTVSVNNLCDFAMKKFFPSMLIPYKNLKQQHQSKHQMDKNNENLDEMYHQLKQQFQFAKQSRHKSKAQRVLVKYADSQTQTIHKMQEKQFDNYFSQDVSSIIQKLAKLNQLRQKVLKKQNSQKKFTVLKNICLDIKHLLLKLLLMMLKGQQFYKKGSNSKRIAPNFTYNQLLSSQNVDQAQTIVLQLIYTRIDQFEVQTVDEIRKQDIIKLYVQQRAKNTKILQIINAQ